MKKQLAAAMGSLLLSLDLIFLQGCSDSVGGYGYGPGYYSGPGYYVERGSYRGTYTPETVMVAGGSAT